VLAMIRWGGNIEEAETKRQRWRAQRCRDKPGPAGIDSVVPVASSHERKLAVAIPALMTG
jgi:hypothetical protein